MRHQLVIQFPATSMDDFDRLISFEGSIEEQLGDSAELDGHDFGSGEFNIFVLTDVPAAIFEKVHEAAKKQPRLLQSGMRAAYRDLGGEDFTILWPPNLKKFSIA